MPTGCECPLLGSEAGVSSAFLVKHTWNKFIINTVDFCRIYGCVRRQTIYPLHFLTDTCSVDENITRMQWYAHWHPHANSHCHQEKKETEWQNRMTVEWRIKRTLSHSFTHRIQGISRYHDSSAPTREIVTRDVWLRRENIGGKKGNAVSFGIRRRKMTKNIFSSRNRDIRHILENRK